MRSFIHQLDYLSSAGLGNLVFCVYGFIFSFPPSPQCCCRAWCPSTWTRRTACRSKVRWRTCSATPSSSLRTARGNGEWRPRPSSFIAAQPPPRLPFQTAVWRDGRLDRVTLKSGFQHQVWIERGPFYSSLVHLQNTVITLPRRHHLLCVCIFTSELWTESKCNV